MTDEINKIVNKQVEDATKKTEEKFHNEIKQLKYDHSLERLRDAVLAKNKAFAAKALMILTDPPCFFKSFIIRGLYLAYLDSS